MRSESFVSQHGVDERSTGSTVAIGEWMNRLELRMGQCGLHEHGNVVTAKEREQIVDRRLHELRLRRHE